MKTDLEMAIDLLIARINIWSDDIRDNIKNEKDLESAIEKICEAATKFGADISQISQLLSYIDAKRIEEIIESLKKKLGFAISKTKTLDNDIKAEWILRKKLRGKTSELTIQLYADNHIHVCSWTDDWNLLAYGYNTLKSAIISWAEGRM